MRLTVSNDAIVGGTGVRSLTRSKFTTIYPDFFNGHMFGLVFCELRI